jgi:hypothetical protein
MKIVKMNAAENLRIVDWNGSFSAQLCFNGDWVTVADAETRQAANAAFKSFEKSAAAKKATEK